MLRGEKRNAGVPLHPLPVRTEGNSPVRTSRRSSPRPWSQNADHTNTNKSRRDDSYSDSSKAQHSNHNVSNENENRDDKNARGIPRQDHGAGGGQDHFLYEERSNSPSAMRLKVPPAAARGGLNSHRSGSGLPVTSKKASGGGGDGISRSAAELRGRIGASGVDRGLAGVGLSTSSSLWALPPPPAPSGHAVPALLSHLAELRSLCQRQRESGRSLRGALVRKQGELDEISTEASWLRAELGFIVGDMLGSLQQTPTAATVFGALSERIRADLGAEAAAVYIDVGGGNLWLLPHSTKSDRNMNFAGSVDGEIFVQRGVGVVGLVAMGAMPGATSFWPHSTARKKRADPPEGGGGDGVEVLLLNDGLEAFDNGTTVEAALLRAARGFHGEDDNRSTAIAAGLASGAVRNMLVARVGSGMTMGHSQGEGNAASKVVDHDDGSRSSYLPEPPTAVIQALNKQAAPERFTEGDARAVRSLAPAVSAGSRLIMALLSSSRESSRDHGVGRPNGHQTSSSSTEPCALPEERFLMEGLRRAREALGADRARIFVLNAEAAPSHQLRLWHEDPTPSRSRGVAVSSSWSRGVPTGGGGAEVGVRMAADSGLEGLALSTGRVVRVVDVLSDPLYDRELDLKEGFLTRSVLCAPLFASFRDGDDKQQLQGAEYRGRDAPLGVLQLAIGRGKEESGVVGRESGSFAEGARVKRGVSEWKRYFTEKDERSAELIAEEVAGLLSALLGTGYQPRAAATMLAGGAGHVDAHSWVGMGNAYRSAGNGNPAVSSGAKETATEETKTARERGMISEGGTTHPRSSGSHRLATSAVSAEMTSVQTRTPGDGGVGATSGTSTGVVPPRWRPSRARVQAEEEAEARDSVVRTTLGSSTASTVEPSSPPESGLRASVATAWATSPTNSPPSPPLLATDGGNSASPPGHEGRRAGVYAAREGQKPSPRIEEIQASSWTTAHKVLEACKENLAADKRSRLFDDPGLSAGLSSSRRDGIENVLSTLPPPMAVGMNMERLAPAVCSLVSSLLPDCSAILLILDRKSGRLREANCEYELGVDDDTIARLRPPRPIRREDVARRALASGKALLAHAGEKRHKDGTVLHVGHGATGNVRSHRASDRLFCVPVIGSAGHAIGVLQLFLPTTRPFGEALGAYRGGPEHNTSSSPPPPPSFFMATKIMADCVGLALDWCEALDREEKDRATDQSAAMTKIASVEKTAAEVHERSQRELMARYESEARDAAQSFSAQIADSANAHALVIGKLLEDREALATAAAEAAARAHSRREAAKCLTAWRDVVKRLQRSEINVDRMTKSRTTAAFRKWRKRVQKGDIERNMELRGAATADRWVLRHTIRVWARKAARGWVVEQQRLAGARLIGEVWRKKGAMRRCFSAWRTAARGASSALEALSREHKEEIERELLLAREEIARQHKQAETLTERIAEFSERRRQERAMRSSCHAWWETARRRRRYRDIVQGSGLWRRRRELMWSLTRWRRALVPTIGASATENRFVVGRHAELNVAGNHMVVVPLTANARASERHELGRGSTFARGNLAATTAYRKPRGIMWEEEEAGKGVLNLYLRKRVRETESRLSRVMAIEWNRRLARALLSAWRQHTAAQRTRKAALSQVLQNLFRRRPLSMAFVSWRIVAALPVDNCKNERNSVLLAQAQASALSRVVRNRQRRLLSTRFGQWWMQARDVAAVVGRETALRNTEMAKKTRAAAAAAAAATVKNATRRRREELKSAKDAVAELQKVVEVLREEVAAGAAREQAVEACLQQTREQASALSLAAALSFRGGRDRLKAARALASLRNVGRARRLAATAADRVSALHLSRCLRAWNIRAQRMRHCRVALQSAVVFREEVSARVLADGARVALREWAAGAAHLRREKRGAVIFGIKLRHRRLRTTLRIWTGVCRVRHASAVARQRREGQLARLLCRRALGMWRRVAFGECGSNVHANTGGGGRILARLLTVAGRFDDVNCRRRARLALRQWLGLTVDKKTLEAEKMRFKRDADRGNGLAAFRRWRAVTLVHRCLRQSAESGVTFATLHGLSRGFSVWQEMAQLATRRKDALLRNAVANLERTTAVTTSSSVLPQGGNARMISNQHSLADIVERQGLEKSPRDTPLASRQFSRQGEVGGNLTPETMLDRKSSLHPSTNAQPREALPPRAERAEPPEHPRRGASGSSSGSSKPDLLNLLVETCTAPPSYTLDSGLTTLGREACSAAVRIFGLLSATLFEVTGGPQGTAECVASARQDYGDGGRQTSAHGGEEGSTGENSAAASAGWGVAPREPIGEGQVGAAAQSACPICFETVVPLDASGGVSSSGESAASPLAQQQELNADTGSAANRVAGASVLTVLCVPIMLQTVAPLPTVLGTLDSDRSRAQSKSTSGSVQVLGVLRAVRIGSGAFVGDDARAMSAFCGQLALAMMAERTLKEAITREAVSAAKQARALRRQACGKILGLFAKGAVADHFLRGKQWQTAAMGEVGQEAATGNDRHGGNASDLILWGSVAGIAAETLGCESVDLLRVASLVPGAVKPGAREGGGDGAARLAGLLSRLPTTSRSLRRRQSRGSLENSQLSYASGAPSSRDSGGGSGREEGELGSWLCAPVLGAAAGPEESGEANVPSVGFEGDAARRFGGASLVCCALNKGRGRSFDDVDEALLGTIAALFGVASSWMEAPTTPAKSGNATDGPARRRHSQDAVTRAEPLYPRADLGVAPELDQAGKADVSARKMSSDGESQANREGGVHAGLRPTGHFCQTYDVKIPGAAPSPRTTGGGVGPTSRNSAVSPTLQALTRQRTVAGVGSAAAAATHEFQSEVWLNDRGRENSRNPRRAPGVRHDSAENEGSEEERQSTALETTEVHDVANKKETKEISKQRKRADWAEQVLEATRERWCRTFEDGVSSAAAAATAAAAAASATAEVETRKNIRHANDGGEISFKTRGRSSERPQQTLSGESWGRHRRRRSANATARRRKTNRDSGRKEVLDFRASSSPSCFDTDTSSSLPLAGGYYSSDGAERRRGGLLSGLASGSRTAGGEGDDDNRRRRRSSASASVTVGRRVRRQRDVGQDNRFGGAERKNRSGRRDQRAELSASDVVRMREVVDRLRIATVQLAAERARASPGATMQQKGRGGQGREGGGGRWQRPPLSHPVDVGSSYTVAAAGDGGTGNGDGSRRQTGRVTEEAQPRSATSQNVSDGVPVGRISSVRVGSAGLVCDGRAAAEAEAATLVRENASLRRKLNGLVALEELEGRAVRRGLLPLSGGGGILPQGDLFSSHRPVGES